jgi:hypothetical protein
VQQPAALGETDSI